MIELRHLKTLAALRDQGSLIRASERLCLTQSAVSHQLKELESRLGTTLFLRKSRPLRFTEAGKRLLRLADSVLEELREAERDVKKLVHGEAGRLFMAIECHSCFNWLMPVIDRYRQRWPQVELDFSSGFLFQPLEALAREEVDLVITSDPQPLEGVRYVPLFRYELQFALANTHPLARQPFLQPGDLAKETIITYPVERSRLDVFHRFLDPAGVEPKSIRRCELTPMMVQLAASGLGLCALPNWVLADYAGQGLITVRPAGERGIHPVLYAAIRERDEQLPFVEDFLSLAADCCIETLPGVSPPPGP